MKSNFRLSKTSYADIHLHLGGAINPRILWHHIEEVLRTEEIRKAGFDTYDDFEDFFKKKRHSLEEYLQMHDVVEPLQRIERLDYFIKRLMRGAYEFENLTYLEIRYCPYSRTTGTDEPTRIKQMRDVIEVIQNAIDTYSSGKDPNEEFYPMTVKQILCLHSQSKYSAAVNRAILELAIEYSEKNVVVGLDIAGGEKFYEARFDEILDSFKIAHEAKIGTTAHLFETKDTPEKFRRLLPYLKRIGHGIQIPIYHLQWMDELKARGICLEICPTTYFKCGSFKDYSELATLFDVCFKKEVDVTIGTDNSGMHKRRLQNEFENLLIHRVLVHEQLDTIRKNAFKHAFGLNEQEKFWYTNNKNIKIDMGDREIDIHF